MQVDLRSRAARILAAAILVTVCHAISPVSAEANFTNGPPSPGPIIVRINNALSRVITNDPVSGLIAIHGRVSGLTECTDASTRASVDIQIVRTPADAQGLNLLLTGSDNEVAIYDTGSVGDLSPFNPATFCPFITNTTPVYKGTVQYRLHVNGGGNQLFQWEGQVTRTSDGAQFHYVEMQYAVAQGDVVSFLQESIALQLVGK